MATTTPGVRRAAHQVDAAYEVSRCSGCGRMAVCTEQWPEARDMSGVLASLEHERFCGGECLVNAALRLCRSRGQRDAVAAIMRRRYVGDSVLGVISDDGDAAQPEQAAGGMDF